MITIDCKIRHSKKVVIMKNQTLRIFPDGYEKTRYHILEQIYCNILKNKKGFALLGVKNFLYKTRGI